MRATMCGLSEGDSEHHFNNGDAMKTPEEIGLLFQNLRKAVNALRGIDAIDEEIKALEDENGMIDGAKVQALMDEPGKHDCYGVLIRACRAIADCRKEIEDDWKKESKWWWLE